MDMQNFINVFENSGRFLIDFFSDVNSMYIATFIFFTVLIYVIILAIIGKVPGLGTEKKANQYGKVVSLAMALISSVSIFRLGYDKTAKDVVTKILVAYGVFAGAVMALLFFAVIYFGLGNKEEGRWHLAVLGSGLSMAIAGYFISKPMVQALGWLVGVIGIILYISTAGVLPESTHESKK